MEGDGNTFSGPFGIGVLWWLLWLLIEWLLFIFESLLLLLVDKLSANEDCDEAIFEFVIKLDAFKFDGGRSQKGVIGVGGAFGAGNFGDEGLSDGLRRWSFFNSDAAVAGGDGECERSFFGDLGRVNANACVWK